MTGYRRRAAAAGRAFPSLEAVFRKTEAFCVSFPYRSRVPSPDYTAAEPRSCVLIRIASSIFTTNTFPSPTLPVRAAATIAWIAFCS
jgi:hypothetical protein